MYLQGLSILNQYFNNQSCYYTKQQALQHFWPCRQVLEIVFLMHCLFLLDSAGSYLNVILSTDKCFLTVMLRNHM